MSEATRPRSTIRRPKSLCIEVTTVAYTAFGKRRAESSPAGAPHIEVIRPLSPVSRLYSRRKSRRTVGWDFDTALANLASNPHTDLHLSHCCSESSSPDSGRETPLLIKTHSDEPNSLGPSLGKWAPGCSISPRSALCMSPGSFRRDVPQWLCSPCSEAEEEGLASCFQNMELPLLAQDRNNNQPPP
eukprot:CAMPEP_0114559520 /NCGR_PEP_ID=MMETSP0114-20121206/10962_1 /TAXON_ID=31324 /ORGANISM="Goniomonas sp, Strain m" /LENGTH=186 /DNA_ID=CAMNT_0001744989 /DNA_START=20 /DNA_END=580 /DNA_ORIENTATION=+